jgi:hypothetical protein
MIYKVITVHAAAQSNIAEAEFLNKKDELAGQLVSILRDKLKLTVTGKSVGSAPDAGNGAVVQVNLKFARSPGILPDTSHDATGRFVVTKQGDDLSVSLQMSNWGFADNDEFNNFKDMWDVSVSKLLKELVERTYPYEITQI